MKGVYDGSWRTARNNGLTVKVSTTVHTLKALGRLGVWEYDAIPSRNIGMQLLGFGIDQPRGMGDTRRLGRSGDERLGVRLHRSGGTGR
jgi:hypothetical protein